MKLRNLFLTAVLLSATLLQAQQNDERVSTPNHWMLGIEMGTEGIFGSFRDDKWSVRQSFGSFGNFDSRNSSVFANAGSFYFGVKPEFVFGNGRLSVASGLRYLSVNCTLDNNSRFGFFFLRYGEVGTDTRYARVRSISENYHFIGIPLELRWRPIRFPNPQFNFHLMVGADAYFKLGSNIEIDFVNDFMQNEKQTILDYVGVETNNFLSRAHFGFGASYTFENRMAITVDVLFPFFLTENNFALIGSPINSSAVQFSFQIPLSSQF